MNPYYNAHVSLAFQIQFVEQDFTRNVGQTNRLMQTISKMNGDLKFVKMLGGRHSSVVSSVPAILQQQVRILSTPFTLFSFRIIEIVKRKGRK